MTDIKEFNLVDVKNNSTIINNLNNIYKLWGYEEVSPSFINTLETIKGRGVIEENEVVGIVSNNSSFRVGAGSSLFAIDNGVVSADAGINVGTAITISTNGNAAFTGIITASNFVGNGANLTNLNVDASGWTPVAGSGQTGIHNSASSGAARVGIGTSIPHFVLDVGTV